MWSTTVLMDLPENVGIEELHDFNCPKEIDEKHAEILKLAYSQIQCGDGEITDIQTEDEFSEVVN